MSTSAAAATRLLDRESELAQLGEALNGARAGAGALVMVEGGAGIGKTTLLRRLRDRAAGDDFIVLAGRGGELERELPFGVVRQLFEARLSGAGPEARRRLLDGAAALAAPAVDPETDPELAPATYATLHGLHWLTANIAAEQPLLITVDDAQWADAPSLRFLAYLAPRLAELPVLLAVAVRTGDAETDPAALSALAGSEGARTMRPGPLGRASVAALVQERLGKTPSPAFTDACVEATGGNPFLVRQLVDALAERGMEPAGETARLVAGAAPEAVGRSTGERLRRLPDGAAEIAAAVAILGDGSDLHSAAAVAGVPVGEAGGLADGLAAAGLFVGGRTLEFVHPLVRAAVADGLDRTRRDELHRAAAGLLAESGDDDRVAAHLAAVRPAGDQHAVQVLSEAAARAVSRGAPETAVDYLRRALEEPPDASRIPDVMTQLGLAELRAGDPAAIDHLGRAVELAGSPPAIARAALAHGRALAAFGRFAEAVAAFDQGLGVGPGETQELELLAELVGAAPLALSTRELGMKRMRELDPDDLRPDSIAACKLLASLAREEMAALGSRTKAIELAERSLSGGFLMADEPLISFPHAPLVLMYAGELSRAVTVHGEAIARSNERGAILAGALLRGLRGMALQARGDLEEAVADIRASLRIATEHDAPVISFFAAGFLAWVLTITGDLEEAETALGQVEAVAAVPESFASVTVLRTRGQLRLEQGRLEEAASDLRECGERLERWQVRNPGVATWRSALALTEQRRGNREQALELADAEVVLAREWGAGWVLAGSLRIAGAIRGGVEGEAMLREAADAAAASGARLEHARALVELGSLLRRGGARKESRRPLRAGLDLALACGVRPLAGHAHAELVASGAQPRRLRETGADALTPAEARVARMAAGGLTNRRIAQTLFVSEKTVESQLRSVFRKLGISSRSQLESAGVEAAAG